jgi:hypothetical protein
MTKPRRMRMASHVACMGQKGTYTGFWCESQMERDHYYDLDLGMRMIIKFILEKKDDVV